MSHLYVAYENNDLELRKEVASITLSNTSHEDWQEMGGLTRSMRNTETNEVQEWPFATTSHDLAPLGLYYYELEVFTDAAQDKLGGDVPPHMEMLTNLIDACEAHFQETGAELIVYIF